MPLGCFQLNFRIYSEIKGWKSSKHNRVPWASLTLRNTLRAADSKGSVPGEGGLFSYVKYPQEFFFFF